MSNKGKTIRRLKSDVDIDIYELLGQHVERLPDVDGEKRCKYKNADDTDEKMAAAVSALIGVDVSPSSIERVRDTRFGRLREPRNGKGSSIEAEQLNRIEQAIEKMDAETHQRLDDLAAAHNLLIERLIAIKPDQFTEGMKVAGRSGRLI